MSQDIIQDLRKKYPKEFKVYNQELLKKNIEDVREGLDILLSIKGIVPDRPEGE